MSAPKFVALLAFLLASLGSAIHNTQTQKQRSAEYAIPKAWDPAALATLEVPLAEPSASPVPVSPDFYYAIPVRPIYKSYTVYAPGHEPPGYIDWLKQQEPEVIWGKDGKGQLHAPERKTGADWIKMGEIVFDAPIFYDQVAAASQVTDPAWYKAVRPELAADGTLPNARYIIREKGKLELGNNACAFCHTRLMPDGTVIKGAQGNFPFDRSLAFSIREQAAGAADKEEFLRQLRGGVKSLTGAPWLHPDPNAAVDRMSVDEIAAAFDTIPPAVAVRHGTSVFFPPRCRTLSA